MIKQLKFYWLAFKTYMLILELEWLMKLDKLNEFIHRMFNNE